jgi:hypothetical protein
MLNFKLRDIDLSLATTKELPLGSVIFVANNDLNNYANKSNWSLIDMSQSDGSPSLIKIVDPSSIGKIKYTTVSDSITTNSNGDHVGPSTGLYRSWLYYSGVDTTRPFITKTTGAHNHSVSNLSNYLSNNYPLSIVVGAYKSNQITNVIPKNTIIFTDSPNSDLDLIDTSKINCFMISGNSNWLSTYSQSNNGLFGSNNYSSTSSLVMGSSGDHEHSNYGNYNGFSNISNYTNNGQENLTAGSHTHVLQNFSASIELKRTLLKTYKTNKDTFVFQKMIIGYANTDVLSLASTGWYVCNGQTVGAYTTPNLTNRYPQLNTTFHNVSNPVGSDFNQYKITSSMANANSHTHKGATTSRSYTDGTYIAQHDDYNSWTWAHSHTLNNNLNYEPSYYGLSFIIYLGS